MGDDNKKIENTEVLVEATFVKEFDHMPDYVRCDGDKEDKINSKWYQYKIENLENADLFIVDGDARIVFHPYIKIKNYEMATMIARMEFDKSSVNNNGLIEHDDLCFDLKDLLVFLNKSYVSAFCDIFSEKNIKSLAKEHPEKITAIREFTDRYNNLNCSSLLSQERWLKSSGSKINLLEIIVDSIEKQYLEDSSNSLTIERINEIKEKIRIYNDFRKRVVEKEKKEEKQREKEKERKTKEERQKVKLLKSLKNEIKEREKED